MAVEIYTDCSSFIHNKGKDYPERRDFAAYAFSVFKDNQLYYQESGSKEDLRTGGGELLAVIRAIQFAVLEGIKDFIIYTDAKYVSDNFRNNLTFWATQVDWTNASGEIIANKSYWEYLYHLKIRLENNGFNMTIKHVKGHTGVEGNELSDKLAGETMKRFREQKLKINE